MEDTNKLLKDFKKEFQSLILATLDEHNMPYTSYAPFVYVNGFYYVIISRMAKHYNNILKHPYISIMMIEDEAKTDNIFFRKRLTYQGISTLDIDDCEVIRAFTGKHGIIVETLMNMDFNIIKFTIKDGMFNIGAGKAYAIDEHEAIKTHMKISHQKKT